MRHEWSVTSAHLVPGSVTPLEFTTPLADEGECRRFLDLVRTLSTCVSASINFPLDTGGVSREI